MSRNSTKEYAAHVESATLSSAEDRHARNLSLARSVGQKWRSRYHDPGCPGDHDFEISTNGLVKYPCPL